MLKSILHYIMGGFINEGIYVNKRLRSGKKIIWRQFRGGVFDAPKKNCLGTNKNRNNKYTIFPLASSVT